MVVLVNTKNDKDPIKNEGASADNTKYQFFQHSRAANSTINCGIW